MANPTVSAFFFLFLLHLATTACSIGVGFKHSSTFNRRNYAPKMPHGWTHALHNGQNTAAAAQIREAGKKWCVPKPYVGIVALQQNVGFACMYIDCKPIRLGGHCFYPNNVMAHATYAMNAYYQKKGVCGISNAGVLTNTNPSYGNCKM